MSSPLKKKRRPKSAEPKNRTFPFQGYTQTGPIMRDSNPSWEAIPYTEEELDWLNALLDKPQRSQEEWLKIQDLVFDTKRAFYSPVPDIPGYEFLRIEGGMYLDPISQTINICTCEESIDAQIQEERMITGYNDDHMMMVLNFGSALRASMKYGYGISIDEAYRSSLGPVKGTTLPRLYLYMEFKDGLLRAVGRTPENTEQRKKAYAMLRKQRMESQGFSKN